MNKNKVYTFYSDPGHGWIAVKLSELLELGISDKITEYSYMRGNTAYLEEDCDASTFFEAYKAKYGIEPKFKSVIADSSSPIRSYDGYSSDFINRPALEVGQKWDFKGSNGILEIYNIEGSNIYLQGVSKYKVPKYKFFSYRPELIKEYL